MNSILYSMLESLALRMTVVTIFVMAIKLIFKNKLSAKMHCMIWLILCIQLMFCICGIRIQTPASIYNVLPEYSDAVTVGSIPLNKKADIRSIAAFIWFGGFVLMSAWHGFAYALYRRTVRRSPVIDDEVSISSLKSICTLLGIRKDRRVTLRRGNMAQTLSDTVILPDGFTQKEEYQMLLHELCHFRHYDNVKLWLALEVLCLNWFNPLIWIAFRRFRTDVEMLCDERVLKLTDSRKEYAQMLVRSAAARRRFVPGAVSVNNGKAEVTARIKRIAVFKRMNPIWGLAAACACVTISCLCLTDAVSIAVENTVAEETSINISTTPEPVSAAELLLPAQQPTSAPTAKPAEENRTKEQRAENSVKAPHAEAEKRNSNAAHSNYTSETKEAFEQDAEPDVKEEAVPEADKAEAAEGGVTELEMGNSRDSVYASVGNPHEVSANGSKETYKLDNGKTAVLQYDGDTLENGYIVDGEISG